jgi:hypothetical protein
VCVGCLRALELVLVLVWVNEEGPEGAMWLIVVLCVRGGGGEGRGDFTWMLSLLGGTGCWFGHHALTLTEQGETAGIATRHGCLWAVESAAAGAGGIVWVTEEGRPEGK